MLVRYEKVDKHKIKSPTKPQARREFDQAELERLADSLVTGQLQPIGLLADNTRIWGERRCRAAMLRDEITHLWAAVFDEEVSESEFLRMGATENFQRADLTGNEQFLTCKELLNANPQWQQKDLAKALKLEQSAVTKLLSPAKCSQTWRDALAAGRVGIGDCYAASSLPEAEQAALLTMKLSGASRDAIVQAARRSKSGKPAAVKLSRAKIAMPNGATVVVSGEELGMDRLVELLAQTLKEARKAADQYDIRTWVSMMKDRAKAG